MVALALDAGVDRSVIAGDYLATTNASSDHGAPRELADLPPRAEGHDPRAHAPIPGTIERMFELIDESFDESAAWLSDHGLSHATWTGCVAGWEEKRRGKAAARSSRRRFPPE